jgi:hypothetical protein
MDACIINCPCEVCDAVETEEWTRVLEWSIRILFGSLYCCQLFMEIYYGLGYSLLRK